MQKRIKSKHKTRCQKRNKQKNNGDDKHSQQIAIFSCDDILIAQYGGLEMLQTIPTGNNGVEWKFYN